MEPRVEKIAQTRIVHPEILYFGTPVVLLTTLNEDGSSNITPMSSAWALGNRIVLGLGEGGQGLANLRRRGECVVNVPDQTLWGNVESLAPLTGANPVPEHKRGTFRHEKDKFKSAGLTPVPARDVLPCRIAECPLQIESRLVDMRMSEKKTHPAQQSETQSEGRPDLRFAVALRFAVIEVEAVTVHAHAHLALDDSHIDPSVWSPLIYNFRHYFGLGKELGKTFRAKI